MPWRACGGILVWGLGGFMSVPGHAQTIPVAARDVWQADEIPASESQDTPSAAGGSLLGDMGGLRPWLARYGMTLGIQDVNELWGNATGGIASTSGDGRGAGTGASYIGVTMPDLTADLEKLMGLVGGTFNVSALQIRGRAITQDHLADFNPISGFEADRSTRLFELWYQQSFLKDTLDIKIGQQDLDTEFLISDYASQYLNASFGWPMGPSANLYAGGPSWPLAAPAIRLRYRPGGNYTVMFAASDDNPSGNRDSNVFGVTSNPADPTSQTMNDGSGTQFNMGTGALLITEIQYALNPRSGDRPGAVRHAGLPGVYKLGGYYDTARFPDYRYNMQGQSLGAYGGTPRWDRGNWLIYGIVDQLIWRPSPEGARALGVFVRATGNSGDRNIISFAIDAGLNLKAPFAGRTNDTLGLGWGIGRATSGVRAYDRARGALVQGNENHFELTYQAQVTPWMVLQPDFQYVLDPSGGLGNPSRPMRRIGNEAVFGLHTNVNF
ncbi:carbohydrate porin [Komagataeibacter xylinus]|uniref:Carbohydrate porin n=2 Tax=Komagataeibacter rhaeticus TaxID=215221 RepID=A0A858JJ89_9PROT|nr:carbohydrate porin [Komagataeibacter xylinus]QIP37175.1 carbohydrate porin [Komagataeibacter rhaeticus]QOC48306.1 carbohydrate porin [Komagataeibacter rhaeticus]